VDELISVFVRVRAALALPDNDFVWSSWRDANHALEEIDGILTTLRDGRVPNETQMQELFAPTGPIQEVSLSSGWGDAFLRLADDFDAAIDRLRN